VLCGGYQTSDLREIAGFYYFQASHREWHSNQLRNELWRVMINRRQLCNFLVVPYIKQPFIHLFNKKSHKELTSSIRPFVIFYLNAVEAKLFTCLLASGRESDCFGTLGDSTEYYCSDRRHRRHRH